MGVVSTISAEDVRSGARAPLAAQAAPLKRRAVAGAIWSLGGYGGGQVIRLAANLVLTRLLCPDAFGLLATIYVMVQGLEMFADIGIGPSIIQDPRGEEACFQNTAWTIQVIRGVILWLGACAAAVPAAWFFGVPEMAAMLPVAGLTGLVTGFRSTAWFTVNRHLLLGRRTVIELSSSLLAAATMIGLALVMRSTWAMILGSLAGTVVQVILSHLVLAGPWNRLAWDRPSAEAIFRFGRWIFVNSLLGFLGGQIDRPLMLKIAGASFAGVYSIGTTLTALPLQVLQQLTQVVLYPVLAEHARRGPASLSACLGQTRRILMPVALCASVGIVLVAPMFFWRLYDSRYADAGWIAQLGAIAVWFAMARGTSDRALLAVGDTRALAISNLLRVVGTIGGCWLGHWYAGRVGFVAGIGFGALCSLVVNDTALELKGLRVAATDGLYTLACLLVGGLAAVVEALARSLGRVAHAGVYAAVIGLWAGLTAWAGYRAWSVIRSRRSAAVAAPSEILASEDGGA